MESLSFSSHLCIPLFAGRSRQANWIQMALSSESDKRLHFWCLLLLRYIRAVLHTTATRAHARWKTRLPPWLHLKRSTTTRYTCTNSSPGERVRLVHSHCIRFRTKRENDEDDFPHAKKQTKQTKENEKEKYLPINDSETFLVPMREVKKGRKTGKESTLHAQKILKNRLFLKALRYMRVSRNARVSTRNDSYFW